MDDTNPPRRPLSMGTHDSRDSRTGEHESARPVEQRDTPSEVRSLTPPDDPVSAANPMAKPSDYSAKEIEEGETPLDDEMERMVDPSIRGERLSTNPDVMDLDTAWRTEGEEPDFMQSPGTTDVIESIEEGEPYFPPTDPPLRPGAGSRAGRENVNVMGGFAATSLEEPSESEDHPLRLLTNDEEIAEQVRYALAADAYTADLNIEVDVEDGVVYLRGSVSSMQDVEQAEQVAGSVPGVDEVQEELELE